MATSPAGFQAVVSSSAAKIGNTVGTATTRKIYEIIFYNDHTSAVGISLWFVPSGGSAAAGNKLLDSSTYLIPAKTHKQFTLEQRIAAGGEIHAQATVDAKVTAHVSYDEVI